MKKLLLVAFALLTMGLGARHVYLLAEDWKHRSDAAHTAAEVSAEETHAAAAKNVEHSNTQDAAPATEVRVADASATEVAVVPPETPAVETGSPQVTTPAVQQISTPSSEGDSLYFLLHPDRKIKQETPVGEQAK